MGRWRPSLAFMGWKRIPVWASLQRREPECPPYCTLYFTIFALFYFFFRTFILLYFHGLEEDSCLGLFTTTRACMPPIHALHFILHHFSTFLLLYFCLFNFCTFILSWDWRGSQSGPFILGLFMLRESAYPMPQTLRFQYRSWPLPLYTSCLAQREELRTWSLVNA